MLPVLYVWVLEVSAIGISSYELSCVKQIAKLIVVGVTPGETYNEYGFTVKLFLFIIVPFIKAVPPFNVIELVVADTYSKP